MAISAGRIIFGGGALFLLIWGLGHAGSHSPTSPSPEVSKTEAVSTTSQRAQPMASTQQSTDPCSDSECVTAKVGHPVVPGAIICHDLDTVSLMIGQYEESWGENFRATAMGADKARKLYGSAIQPPNLAQFGCALLAPGTPMKWDGNWTPPTVMARLPDGRIISGVTDPSMVDNSTRPTPPNQSNQGSEGQQENKFQWNMPATLHGTFNKGTFTDCCEAGIEKQRPYYFIRLDATADIISKSDDDIEPTTRGIQTIQLGERAGNDFAGYKKGQKIVVSCKQLWYGNTGHYALPAYCAEAKLRPR